MKQSIGEFIQMLISMPKINKHLKKLQAKGYPVKSMMDIMGNDNETNTIVYTSKEFQPCAETFSDKYCFMGPSVRPISSKIKKTAAKTIYISMGTVVKNSEIYRNCIDVFLTHCGMNSTLEALYYEVPLVMFPQTAEQRAVAKRVEELGAGEVFRKAEFLTVINTGNRLFLTDKRRKVMLL